MSEQRLGFEEWELDDELREILSRRWDEIDAKVLKQLRPTKRGEG